MAERRMPLWGSLDDIPDRFSVLPAVEEERDHPGRAPADFWELCRDCDEDELDMLISP